MSADRSAAPEGAPAGRRLLGLSLLVFAIYAAVGLAMLAIGQFTGLASPIWPAAGIAFAVVYEWGWRMTPAIALGSLAANLLTLSRQESLTWVALAVTVAIAVGAALQAQVAATLVAQAIGRRAPLITGREIIAFLLFSGPLAAMVSATIATVAQVASGLVSADQWIVLWVTWWAGDSIGVVVFGSLTLMCLPGQRMVWQGRRWKIAIPTVAGALLFTAFVTQTQNQALQAQDVAMQEVADQAASDLRMNVARHQEVLEGMASLFHSASDVSPEDFATFTEGALARFPSLQALSWNPIVTHGEVPAFEAAQRARGLEGFRITQRDAAGELVPAMGVSDHVVVGYIEPLAENGPALGFDIGSNPTRRDAIDRALVTKAAVATAPVDLVQESGSQKGMLALVPIIDDAGAVEAFAVGAYRLGDLLSYTFESPRWADLDIRLLDVTDSLSPTEVALREAEDPPSVDLTTAAVPQASSDVFGVYGRSWQLVVSPTSGPLAARDFREVPTEGIIGVILLTLLQAFVLVVTGTERRAQRRADDFDRMANTDDLTGVGNRRAFLSSLAAVRRRTKEQGLQGMLLFIDLDRFKSVNDVGGHEAGDAMLQKVARTLVASVRSRDFVSRIGGDEFAVILNECPALLGTQIAETLAERIGELRVSTSQGPIGVGASIGVMALDSGDDRGIDELIRLADDACYQVKSRGGGVFVST